MSRSARLAAVRFYVDADVLGLAKVHHARDRHIQDHHAEIEAVRVSGARMVNLAGAQALDTFHQMEALMCQWQKVQALLEVPGPFIYSLTRTTLRALPLKP